MQREVLLTSGWMLSRGSVEAVWYIIATSDLTPPHPPLSAPRIVRGGQGDPSVPTGLVR